MFYAFNNLIKKVIQETCDKINLSILNLILYLIKLSIFHNDILYSIREAFKIVLHLHDKTISFYSIVFFSNIKILLNYSNLYLNVLP